MQTKMLQIQLDASGRGWTNWNPGLGRDPVLVGIVPQDPYPPDDGYWDDPDEDLTFRAQPRAGEVIISAVNGPPNETVVCWVSYV